MAEFKTAERAVQIKVRVMRCHEDGCSAGIDFLENAENFFSVFRVQVTGRFVRQKQVRVMHHRTGNRHALLFTARERVRHRKTLLANAHERKRVKNSRVATRQASAHPVSECLGTFMIAVVLWFGGTLILKDNAPIDAPTFIFFMVILYSIIAPIKDLSKAAYSIPKGMASMERINKILESENPIKDAPDAVDIQGFDKGISFKGVSFRYPDGNRDVL